MAEYSAEILAAIQAVSVVDFHQDPDNGRLSNVGPMTAAMIFNVVRAAEGRAIDPAEDWQIASTAEHPHPYSLLRNPGGGVVLSVPDRSIAEVPSIGEPGAGGSGAKTSNAGIALDTPEAIDELIARLRRARASLTAEQGQ